MSYRSGSVPNLSEKARLTSPLLRPRNHRRVSRHHHHHNKHREGSILHRSSRENSCLRPGLLKYHRHAISVDETGPMRQLNGSQCSTHGSQCSVTFDTTPEIIDIAPVHKRRHPKRSDTGRRHLLSRQKQIEREEQMANSPSRKHRRRSSTLSENSISKVERNFVTSRNSSIDSKCTFNASAIDLCGKSPEKVRNRSKICGDSEECR